MRDNDETLYLARTPTYGEVEAWYIHDCDVSYSVDGIQAVIVEAIKVWPKADVGGLYVLVLLVITAMTRDNPTWSTCTIS